MNRFRISTPEGTRDLLVFLVPCAAADGKCCARRAGGARLQRDITPAVEYFDVFAQANPELDQDQMLKIIDKSGRFAWRVRITPRRLRVLQHPTG